MSVHESGEMYLEAILVLTRKTGFVRSIDVSEYLGYSKPSVSRAMGLLRQGEGSMTILNSSPDPKMIRLSQSLLWNGKPSFED